MEAFLSHPVIAVVILLGALVFVHELGHFLAGRWCGIAVETFSIGFGPVLFSVKRGLTDYRLSAIPLGGYVKFYGSVKDEPVPRAARGQEFFRASYVRRMITVAAGPLANFLLAALAFAVLGHAGIPHPPAVVGDVLPGSAAEAAGVFPGDKLLEIDGKELQRWRELESAISKSAGRKMDWHVERGSQKIHLQVTPAEVEVENILGRKTKIGRAGVSLGIVPATIAVLSRDSVAARSGLRTGDRMVAIGCREAAEPSAVAGYGDFVLRLNALAGQCPSAVAVRFKRGNAESTVDLVFSGAPGRRLQPENQLEGAATSFAAVREFAGKTGFEDAQLVVDAEKLTPPFQAGDRLLSFNGKKVEGVFGLRDLILLNQQPAVKILVDRDFQQVVLDVELKAVDTQQARGKVVVYTLPVQLAGGPEEPQPVIEKYPQWHAAIGYGFAECWRQVVVLSGALFHLFSGEIPLKALGGPIMIAKVAGDSAKVGWQAFLSSLALISVNLGLVNLVPIPVLDGGQMVLFSVEAVLRRPLSQRALESFQRLGFVLVMALVILATYNDFSRFWKSMLAAVVGEGG